ncbi:E3 ubiquitin-protein ligase Topors-like [Ruditapes philippinarum]|uniref:E3 ubiquitin-protein ligase Topors-like n=1 Tax=Ruditapes philippinarum TaxID=129788 RepID=UPI00295AE767|nr:E3 ubiquitin-protein ligase Topors-like [Ruditapes philippinarum]
MDKRKKKNSASKRKKRLQLDEDEEENYSRSYTSSRPSQASSSLRHDSSSSQVTASSGIGHGTSTSLPRSSTSVSSTSLSTAISRNTTIFHGHLRLGSSTVSNESNNSNQNSEGGATNSTPPRPKSSSPEPNCAICLGPLENKSFTDSCFHQFCFVCLVEWSKVKAECPLCKQSFKSIVHNVRSYDDYDQYHIPRPEDRNLLQELARPGTMRFSYRTTVTDHRYTTLADRINREIESRLLQRPSRSLPIPNYRRLRQPANSDFRRSVYLQRLKLNSPPTNTRRRVRETSPSFFRENPAQTHRLVPWVNRELNALLQGHGEQVAFVLDLIMGLVKRFPIDSEEFYQHVFPYVGRHTRKFMQEFLMFAKSPYHMAAYDRHSSYAQCDEPHHDSESDSDHRAGIRNDGNDSDVIVVSPGNSPLSDSRNSQPPPPRREDSSIDSWESRVLTAGDPYFPGFAPITRTYRTEDIPSMHPYAGLRTDYAPTSASGWDSPTPGPSQLRLTIRDLDIPTLSTGISSQLSNTTSIGGSIWTPSSRSYSAPSSQPLPSTSSIFGNLFDSINLMPQHPPPSSQIENATSFGGTLSNQGPVSVSMNSDSNNSDVEIIEVEKPWNERSPIRLSSGGETDYDVMITGTTHINDPVKIEKKKKKHKKRQEDMSTSQNRERHKRGRETSGESHSKKKRHRSRSKSSLTNICSRSRTRSVSPVRLTLIRSPDYQHKKFSYKTHSDKSEEIDPYRPFGNRISEGSSSLFTSDSDTESHLSITSHRHKSKSKHSSIEIFEYRKKSSKSKKSKKHKKNKGSDDLVISDDDHNVISHHHKHKKHKSAGNEKRRKIHSDGHISSGSHKKSKHKSKKKKHMKDKKNRDDKSNVDKRSSRKINKSLLYTSDSEPDSISDIDVENDSEKEVSDPIQNSAAFHPPTVEFVEVDAAQAAVIDKELDNINKTLADNDYINSLLKDNIVDARDKHEEDPNSDPNRMVNPDDIFNQRSFKKHPYGHKKSNKSQNSSAPQASESYLCSEPLFNSENICGVSKPEDSIQSHDITSCSDMDSDRQLPSFLTFSNFNSNFLNPMKNYRTHFNSPESRQRCPNETPSYESPTSTGLFSCKDVTNKENETVDVDGMSDDSDVDITGITVPSEPADVISYKTSDESIKIGTPKDYIDVVGDSNEEQSDEDVKNNEKCSNIQERNSPEKDYSNNESDIDVENDDSDIECSLVEGHKTFEIDEDSESDNNGENTNNIKNVSDIDITGCSDDEIVIDADEENNKTNDVAILSIDTSSETDLDYNCEDTNSALSSTDCKSESDTDRYEESEENSVSNTDHVTILDNDTELSNAKPASNSSDRLSSDNEASPFYAEIAGTSQNKVDSNTNTNQDQHTINDETTEVLEATESEHIMTGTSNPGGSIPGVSDSGGFRWTSDPVYEARPLSVSNIVDATREFASRDRSTPEQDYIINLPREITPSWEYDSPNSMSSDSSPELQVSPDLRGRSFDEDFVPED